MATKIKLMRLGKMRAPYYRIVVADARTKRDGRSIEMIGKYHPKEDPSFIEVDSERAQYWLGVGAQPTEAVAAILRVTGDWQKFKGEPAPPPMKVKAPKADKVATFQAAALEFGGEPADGATTPKRKAAPKPKADAAKPDTAKPDTAKPDAAKADAAKPAGTEATATDSAGTESPATEAPATEAPATEAPATEAPATEATASDPAATDTAGAETAGTETAESETAGTETKAADAGQPDPAAAGQDS